MIERIKRKVLERSDDNLIPFLNDMILKETTRPVLDFYSKIQIFMKLMELKKSMKLQGKLTLL